MSFRILLLTLSTSSTLSQAVIGCAVVGDAGVDHAVLRYSGAERIYLNRIKEHLLNALIEWLFVIMSNHQLTFLH